MSNGKGGFIGQDGLNAPDPATGVAGSAGEAQVTVSFTAPTDVGGSAITGYRAQSNDGIGASGSSSPITVTGLTNGTSYTSGRSIRLGGLALVMQVGVLVQRL